MDLWRTDGRALKDKLRALPNNYTRKGSDRQSASAVAGLPVAGSASRLSAVYVFFSLLAGPRTSVSHPVHHLSASRSAPAGSCSHVWTGHRSGNFPLGSPTVFTLARFLKGTLHTAALRLASEVPLVIRNRHVQHFVWDAAILCTLPGSFSHFYPLNGYSKWLAPVTGNSVFTTNILWDWKWLWLLRWNYYCPTVLNNL